MHSVKKKILLVFIIATVAILAAVAGAYFCQMFTKNRAKTESDSSIIKVEPSEDDSNTTADVSLQYAGYVTLRSEEKLLTMNFTNPSRSKKTMSLEIIANIDDEEIILAKSDKIRPGYKIESIKYQQDRNFPKGTYDGNFLVHFYDENDNEEIVNSNIKIKVYIK